MALKNNKWIKRIGKVFAFLVASGIFGIISSEGLEWYKSLSNTPEKLIILLSEPSYSKDGMNKQRVYLVNDSKNNILNAKLQFKIPDINSIDFKFEISDHLRFQKPDPSLTKNSFIIVFDKIIGNDTAEKIYYIDLQWKGNPIEIKSIFFESDNCLVEDKMFIGKYLNQNME